MILPGMRFEGLASASAMEKYEKKRGRRAIAQAA
jgi:hypothetical protein